MPVTSWQGVTPLFFSETSFPSKDFFAFIPLEKLICKMHTTDQLFSSTGVKVYVRMCAQCFVECISSLTKLCKESLFNY